MTASIVALFSTIHSFFYSNRLTISVRLCEDCRHFTVGEPPLPHRGFLGNSPQKEGMAELSKSKTVGRYRRGEKIGHGNFGIVYKGVDLQTNRVVAIKTLDLDAVNDEVESVQQEVELLSHLSKAESSNVTKYYGTVLEGSKLWIVMDLCSGGSVRTLLKAGPLEDKFLSIIFREITIAVVAIHREGIIHRDIKAANVLITMGGQVKLCDFGVAANSSLSSEAKRQTIVGTPYWMAPEVIVEGRSYTNKADIWSMGITFYEITTGNPPYSEHEAMRALMLITNSRPPRLEGPKYNPNLKDLIALCLDEDPDARPGAEEVLKHKFLKTYAKSPTYSLKVLLDRYIAWKNKHKDYRDSLLMFNPHQDNDDSESIAPSTHDEDGDSVWDFNIEDSPTSADLTVSTEDLSDAPDSLRELFGVAKKRDFDMAAPTRSHLQQSINDTETGRDAAPAPFISSPDLGPSLRTTNLEGLTGQPEASDTYAQESERHSPTTQPVRLHASHNSVSLTQAYSPISAVPSPGFSFPPAKAQNSQEKLPRAPTAISISRSRSTTAAASGGFRPGYRSRHGSDATAPSDHELALPGSKSFSEISTEPQTSTPISAVQTASHFGEPITSPKLASPNGSPSPKKPANRRRLSNGKAKIALPKLQMPPRNTVKLMPLMSAPAGPARHHMSTLSEDTTASSNSLTSTSLSNNSSNNFSAGSDLKSNSSSMKKNFDWPGDFPPMPRIDTAVFLDNSPDELVFDSLLDLACSFKAAVASLANQFEDS